MSISAFAKKRLAVKSVVRQWQKRLFKQMSFALTAESHQ
jgi:hypothetical protein